MKSSLVLATYMASINSQIPEDYGQLYKDFETIEGKVKGLPIVNCWKANPFSVFLPVPGGGISNAYPEGASLIRKSEYSDNAYSDGEPPGRSDGAYPEESPLFTREPGHPDGEGFSGAKEIKLQELVEMDSTAQESTFKIRYQEGVAIDISAINRNPGGPDNLFMKDGDILTVPRKFQTVRTRGEVYFPNKIVHKPNSSYRRYISQSGGFTEKAKKSKAYVLYANGSTRRTKNFLIFKDYPNVKPGAEIIVPRKPDRRKMSPSEIVSIASGLGTLALIINNLTKN